MTHERWYPGVFQAVCLAVMTMLLVGCASSGGGPSTGRDDSVPSSSDATHSAAGRYAMTRDAYPELPPDVSDVPNAVPRSEPRSRRGNTSPYEVLGKQYHVMEDASDYESRGTASWYGKKFHGYTTSNGEIYDMYKMTAAHKSLPLPSYARVTSVDNGRSVIVKVNDRGPFHDDREIDLSYAAASRLDILGHGTGRVRVEVIDPADWRHKQAGNVASRQAGSGVDNRATASASADESAMGETTAGEATEALDDSARRAASIMAVDDQPGAAGPSEGQGVFLQVAALSSSVNAQRMRSQLQESLEQPVRVTSESGLHRVQVGPLRDEESALVPLREKLRRTGIEQTVVVRSGH
ncbi:septal ring lytic transglycosylase RlpA family protein [Aidingimonas lacisalsi]|uniref:septal ring lytic transglycosylase RlpA family protein n=1 Tax=Aidingimonas lacisalsi TaxID=2604086 RepID=UPI00191C22FC|nr:septal ring lytic transglycosylase RlpA family protein [Aidingimonas lacisalsi]